MTVKIDVYFNIKEELKKRKVNIDKDFIPFIGLSRNGYYLAMRKKRLTLKCFEKISDFFGVNPSYWFLSSEEYNNSGAKCIVPEGTISTGSSEFLSLIREKDKTIIEMAEEIGKLKEQVASLTKNKDVG